MECAQDLSCQPSCQEPMGTSCPRMCGRIPCECKEGFLRDNNLTCVLVDQCNIRKRRSFEAYRRNLTVYMFVLLQDLQKQHPPFAVKTRESFNVLRSKTVNHHVKNLLGVSVHDSAVSPLAFVKRVLSAFQVRIQRAWNKNNVPRVSIILFSSL